MHVSNDWVDLTGEPAAGEWVRIRQRRNDEWIEGRYQRSWEIAGGGWQFVLLTEDGQTRYVWSAIAQRRVRQAGAATPGT